MECVAAQLLGRLVCALASTEALEAVKKVFATDSLDTFCTEMSPRGADDFDENYRLMDAFNSAFNLS